MKVVHKATIMWSAAFKFYLLMMQTYQQSCKGKEGCMEDRRLGRGGGESNLPSRRGWTRSYFNFNSGGVQLYFKAYFTNFRTPPSR